jgi:outer membrane protein assembly factor BamE
MRTRAWFIPLCLLLLCGCVYRIPIQQGNFLEAKDLDQINVGMTRSQVRYLLGTPMVADPFNNSRWDYIYYLKRGRIGQPKQRHFIVWFEGDKVAKTERLGEYAEAVKDEKSS